MSGGTIMSMRETALSKLQQLPEPLLQEVSDFIDFVVLKHQSDSQNRDQVLSLSDLWARWFEEVDRLEIPPIEPVNDYQEGLLNKYRQQGLELSMDNRWQLVQVLLESLKQETRSNLKRGNLSRLRGIAKSSAAIENSDSQEDYITYLSEKYQ
jgi:hypothetical protein